MSTKALRELEFNVTESYARRLLAQFIQRVIPDAVVPSQVGDTYVFMQAEDAYRFYLNIKSLAVSLNEFFHPAHTCQRILGMKHGFGFASDGYDPLKLKTLKTCGKPAPYPVTSSGFPPTSHGCCEIEPTTWWLCKECLSDYDPHTPPITDERLRDVAEDLYKSYAGTFPPVCADDNEEAIAILRSLLKEAGL